MGLLNAFAGIRKLGEGGFGSGPTAPTPQHHSIFTSDVDSTQACLFMIVIVIFTMVFEGCIHNAHHWSHHNHPTWEGMLKGAERELMILGFISFILVLAVDAFEINTSSYWFGALEFSHLWIFLSALCFALQAVLSWNATDKEIKEWEAIAELSEEQASQLCDPSTVHLAHF